jgi:Na+/H+ antiporter NhaD/arsenite permease-like protein
MLGTAMPGIDPTLLSDARVLAAYLIFAGSYFVFAIGKFPWMKIDRPGAAIIGAVLMVAFRIVGAQEALQSIDFATIVLLFAMMVIVANLRLGSFFERIAEWIVARLHPHHLLPTVIFTCGLLSAFLVNDIVCLVMTPFVLHMTRRLRLPPVPYLVAVATASNIGSVATITGNPQNMLIGSLSGIRYLDFLAHLGPIAAAGLVVNWALVYRFALHGASDRVPVAEALTAPEFQHQAMRMKPVAVLVAVLIGFLAGVPPALMAAIGAAVLLITRTVEPKRVYADIDWGLLVFFVGLFIIVAGADRAGLTARLLDPVEHWNLHRMVVFVPVTAALSNIVSNVPAVMLLRTLVASFPDPHAGWLALAMSSTLAGNLTITGSVANIIVVERAAAEGVEIGFREYVRIGVPVTIATLAIGALWLWLTAS